MLIGDIEANARLLRAGDPAVVPLQSLLSPGGVDQAVALIEPTRSGFIELGTAAYDIRLAIAVKMGLPLAGPAGPPRAAGWSFGHGRDGWELSDPTGTIIARCKIGPDRAIDEAAWATQASQAGQVLVAYGMRVGVRVPEGVPTRKYDDRARAEELSRSLAAGRACAAMVRFAEVVRSAEV
jgi:hypothetical protein